MMTSPQHHRGVIQRALGAFRKALGETAPDVAIILGSGLSSFAQKLSDSRTLPFKDIPEFPEPTVVGHGGTATMGTFEGLRVLALSGRFHHFEGHSLSIVTLPMRVLGAWGVKTLVVTNAAGSVKKEIGPGSIVVIKDHINWIGQNPLRGPNLEEHGPRFVDMSSAYDEDFRQMAREVGRSLKIGVPEGVYAAFSGPSYETPAEIRMMVTLGADLVGMSTVPEVIVARHHGIRVLGLSCVTNYAAGVMSTLRPLSHEEVLEATEEAKDRFHSFLEAWLKRYVGNRRK